MTRMYAGKVSEDLEIALREAGYKNVGRPSVGQVIDWFFSEHEIGIGILPVFLGTTDDGFVWDYEIYSPKHHEKNECFEEFDRCAWFAIQAAIQMLEEDRNGSR